MDLNTGCVFRGGGCRPSADTDEWQVSGPL